MTAHRRDLRHKDFYFDWMYELIIQNFSDGQFFSFLANHFYTKHCGVF